MDELGFNKIAGAILATALGVMLIREVPHLLMHSSAPDSPVYQVGPVIEEGPTDAEPVPFPSDVFIASMDASRGAKVFKKCTSCHNADKGGANGTGPNLWNVIGKQAAQKADFKYSAAMSRSGLTWNYETLDGYLAKPTKYIKGTNMNFIGLKKEADRAAVIEYLRIASDDVQPQPVAVKAEVMEEKMIEKEVMDKEMMEGDIDPDLDIPKTETLEQMSPSEKVDDGH